MFARHFESPWRNWYRAAITWCSVAWYVLIAIGVPLPIGGEKDLSRPFLCMHKNCGCRNAEQCYRSCCCHTAAERVAFALSHGQTPPAELLAAADMEAPRVSPKKSCCSKGGCDSGEPAAHVEPAPLVIQDALSCRGAGHAMSDAGAAVLPLAVEVRVSWDELGVCLLLSELAPTRSIEPPSPPPRAG